LLVGAQDLLALAVARRGQRRLERRDLVTRRIQAIDAGVAQQRNQLLRRIAR
jgi:hypothetical protein